MAPTRPHLAPRPLTLLALLVPVASAAAQFDAFDWTFEDTYPGSGSGTLTPAEMVVTGPDGPPILVAASSFFVATAPSDGTGCVHMDWTNTDQQIQFDSPACTVDGAVDEILDNDSDAFELALVFDVQAGQPFGLGVTSDDSFGGPGIARFTDSHFFPDGQTAVDLTTPSATDDGFGSAVTGLGDLVVGSSGDANTVPQAGLVRTFTVSVAFADLGLGLAGTGDVPVLAGTGLLQGGTPYTIALSRGAASSPTLFVLGLTELAAPFKGGVLVPAPDVLVGLTTDATGGFSFGGTWPSGLPTAVPFWMQTWITDAGAPAGLASSNGLRGITR